MDLTGESYHVISVLTNAGGTQGAGGKDNYSTLLTTRGALRNGGGNRSGSDATIETSDSYRIIIRDQATLRNAITSSMKFIIDSVTYTIQHWEKIKDKRQYYWQFNVTKNAN